MVNRLAISYKTKYAISIQANNTLLGFYPKEMETFVHTKEHKCSQLVYIQ